MFMDGLGDDTQCHSPSAAQPPETAYICIVCKTVFKGDLNGSGRRCGAGVHKSHWIKTLHYVSPAQYFEEEQDQEEDGGQELCESQDEVAGLGSRSLIVLMDSVTKASSALPRR